MAHGIEKLLSEKCEDFMAQVNPEIEPNSSAYISHSDAFYAGAFVAAGISSLLTSSLQDAIDEVIEDKDGVKPGEGQI